MKLELYDGAVSSDGRALAGVKGGVAGKSVVMGRRAGRKEGGE